MMIVWFYSITKECGFLVLIPCMAGSQAPYMHTYTTMNVNNYAVQLGMKRMKRKKYAWTCGPLGVEI